jgi:3'(2'), 5'-bisphosphate nucleotidase
VTTADLASNEILRAGCQALFPDIAVISEEDSPAMGTGKSTNDTFFLIDPLDGTKEFMNGREEFAVNVALVESGRASVGLIYAPACDRLFFSHGPGRAFERTAGRRRNLPYRPPAGRQLNALISRSHCDPQTLALLKILQPCKVREMGSSLKFALVAAAEADVYLRLGPTMAWDRAAGQAIVEAAGGVVLQADGSPLRYGPDRNVKVDGFFATRTPQLAERVIAAIRTLESGSAVAFPQ